MDIVIAIIGLAMSVVVAAFIVQPLVVQSHAPASEESPREKLLAERDALYATIRDLDLDFQTGKLLEADYRAMREKYVARGVEILKELDAIQPRPQAADRKQPTTVADDIETAVQARRRAKALTAEDEIEAAIRARRQASGRSPLPSKEGDSMPSLECPNCGHPVEATDRFCGKCGATLTVEASR